MPETRYIEVYEEMTGQLLRLDPYEVSDEEFAREAAALQKESDFVRVQEILAGNPQPLTQPEMWELMHIFGRLHGISD